MYLCHSSNLQQQKLRLNLCATHLESFPYANHTQEESVSSFECVSVCSSDVCPADIIPHGIITTSENSAQSEKEGLRACFSKNYKAPGEDFD